MSISRTRSSPLRPPRARARHRHAGHGGHRHRRRRRHAPLLLQQLRELGRLQQRQLVQLLGHLICFGHPLSAMSSAEPGPVLVRPMSVGYSSAAAAAACLPRSARMNASSRCGAWSRPTSCASGPWIAPTSCARSASRDGRSASALSPCGSQELPVDEPDLDRSAGCVLRERLERLGHARPGPAARSRPPVGPFRCGRSAARADSSMASRARRFLTTLYSRGGRLAAACGARRAAAP